MFGMKVLGLNDKKKLLKSHQSSYLLKNVTHNPQIGLWWSRAVCKYLSDSLKTPCNVPQN